MTRKVVIVGDPGSEQARREIAKLAASSGVEIVVVDSLADVIEMAMHPDTEIGLAIHRLPIDEPIISEIPTNEPDYKSQPYRRPFFKRR